MRMIVPCLIVFFIILIIYQLFALQQNVIEGLANSTAGQYQAYDTSSSNNVGILAQQNAGNIQVLEKQVNTLSELKSEVDTNTKNISSLTTQVGALQQQVTSITQQQKSAADQINKKLPVTGTN